MMTQNYEAYSATDQQVWEHLFQRQYSQLQSCAHPLYLEGIAAVGFTAGRIPRFAEVNQRLRRLTGWQLTVVPGIVPPAQFFELLHRKCFPASTWLRSMEQLDYLEEPDMFHDVFGHVPLLSDPQYCSFFEHMAQLALRYQFHTLVTEMLNRLYWFTIEFGLIQGAKGICIYGAGLLSSYGETAFALGTGACHKAFNLREILYSPFDNSRIQDTYYVAESLEQVYHSLLELPAHFDEALMRTIP